MTITASNHDAWNATMQGYDEIPGTLDELLARPAWQANAACRGQGTAAWFPELGQQTDARQVCAGCPVIEECLAFAIDIPHGFWGNTSPQERRQLRRQRRQVA